jgi:hypothetical protein
MPANSSPLPAHRIVILMSPLGRFLQCKDCELSLEFPMGIHNDDMAKEFGSSL